MNILAQLFASPWLGAGGVAFCFIAGNLLLGLFKDRLPRDGGRKFAFNGKLTAGRPRGAGIILILVFLAGYLLSWLLPEGARYLCGGLGFVLGLLLAAAWDRRLRRSGQAVKHQIVRLL